MSPGVATTIYVLAILGLFVLDRDRKARTSKALWIPAVWLLIIASRPVSVWLGRNVPTELASPEQYLEGSPLDGAVFATLIAVGLIVLATRGSRVRALLQRNGPIVLFYLYCAASILWSDYPGVALKRWVKLAGDLVMVMIILTETDPSAAIRKVITRLGFLLVPLSVLVIKYYPALGRIYHRWTWTPDWVGVAIEKNQLGMICMIFGLASMWCLLQEFRRGKSERRGGPLIAHGTVLVMVMWLFAKAHSMTSLSDFVLAGLLMVVAGTTLPARKPTILHLLVAAILSVSFAAVFFDAGGLLKDLGRDPTLTGRTEIWRQVLSMTGNPLLGTGFASFWLGPRLEKLWSMYWWHPNQAHNGYIEIFLNLGWAGIVLLAVVLLNGYRNAVAALRRDRGLGSLTLAYFVAAVVYNFTEAAFEMTNPVWIVLLLGASRVAEAPAGERARMPYGVRGRPDLRRTGLPAPKTHAYEGGA